MSDNNLILMGILYKETTDTVIKLFFKVHQKLGFGFFEKVYERALIYELKNHGFQVESQKKIEVFYDGQNIGDYYADIVVNSQVILELKAAEAIALEHEFQLINYLKASEMEVGLLLNFGKKAEFKRKIYTNDFKL